MLSPDNEPIPSFNFRVIETYANQTQIAATELYEKFAKGEITKEAVVEALLENVSDVLDAIETKKSFGAEYTVDSEL